MKRLIKRALKPFWRMTAPIRRPVMRKLDAKIHAMVADSIRDGGAADDRGVASRLGPGPRAARGLRRRGEPHGADDGHRHGPDARQRDPRGREAAGAGRRDRRVRGARRLARALRSRSWTWTTSRTVGPPSSGRGSGERGAPKRVGLTARPPPLSLPRPPTDRHHLSRGGGAPGRGRGSDPRMMLAHWPIVLSLLAYADVTVSPARSDRTNTSFYKDLAALDRPTERTNRDAPPLRPRISLPPRRRWRDRQPGGRGPSRRRRRPRLRAGRALVARGAAGSTIAAAARRSTATSTRSPTPTSTSSPPSSPTADSRPTRGSSWRGACTTAASTT